MNEIVNKLEQMAIRQSQMEQKINEQQIQINAIAANFQQLADPRLMYFTTDEPSSAGSRTVADSAIIQHRTAQKIIAQNHGSCMACGGDGSSSLHHGLTCAHIVPNTGDITKYEIWGVSSTIANYTSNIDPYSSANLLILCGIKGEQGTCHDAYGKHVISLHYNVEGSNYKWWVRRPDFRTHNGMDIHEREVTIADPKYRRLLAWRTLATIAMAGPSRVQTVPERVALVDKILQTEADEQL